MCTGQGALLVLPILHRREPLTNKSLLSFQLLIESFGDKLKETTGQGQQAEQEERRAGRGMGQGRNTDGYNFAFREVSKLGLLVGDWIIIINFFSCVVYFFFLLPNLFMFLFVGCPIPSTGVGFQILLYELLSLLIDLLSLLLHHHTLSYEKKMEKY